MGVRPTSADRSGSGSRAVYEQAGAASAMVEAQRQWLKTRESRRLAREASAADLRRQIEELRAQLARYAEALEEDLTSGREKVAVRSREGLKFEKSFLDSSQALTRHLKGKPECRDLMAELLAMSGTEAETTSLSPSPGSPGGRCVSSVRIYVPDLDTLSHGEARIFRFRRRARAVEGFVLRVHSALVAYANVCRTGRWISTWAWDASGIPKASASSAPNHAALFDPLTGAYERGPCLDDSLEPFELEPESTGAGSRSPTLN